MTSTLKIVMQVLFLLFHHFLVWTLFFSLCWISFQGFFRIVVQMLSKGSKSSISSVSRKSRSAWVDFAYGNASWIFRWCGCRFPPQVMHEIDQKKPYYDLRKLLIWLTNFRKFLLAPRKERNTLSSLVVHLHLFQRRKTEMVRVVPMMRLAKMKKVRR